MSENFKVHLSPSSVFLWFLSSTMWMKRVIESISMNSIGNFQIESEVLKRYET